MAWEDTILPASFRGIPFDVISTSDNLERSVAVHEIPYVEGASVEDMGRKARVIQMYAVFYGDDYEAQLQRFVDAIDTPGSGELIHPIFGAIRAQFMRAIIQHEAQGPDKGYVSLDFIDAAQASVLFDRQMPSQRVDEVNVAADSAVDAASSRFKLDLTAVQNLPGLLKEKLSADLLSIVQNARGGVNQGLALRTAIRTGAHYLSHPGEFLDELSDGMVSRVSALFAPIDLRLNYVGGVTAAVQSAVAVSALGAAPTVATYVAAAIRTAGTIGTGTARFTRGSLSPVWRMPLETLKQPLLAVDTSVAGVLPASPFITSVAALQPNYPVPSQPFLVAHLAVQQSVSIAGAAAKLFAMAIDDPVLTPGDIETVSSDVRTSINSTLTYVRAIYPDVVQSRPITEPLKALALAVSDAAEHLIRTKPTLVDRTVQTPGNLALLAHFWYGDHRRSDELLRLNPEVANPNFIASGATLRAYAR